MHRTQPAAFCWFCWVAQDLQCCSSLLLQVLLLTCTLCATCRVWTCQRWRSMCRRSVAVAAPQYTSSCHSDLGPREIATSCSQTQQQQQQLLS